MYLFLKLLCKCPQVLFAQITSQQSCMNVHLYVLLFLYEKILFYSCSLSFKNLSKDKKVDKATFTFHSIKTHSHVNDNETENIVNFIFLALFFGLLCCSADSLDKNCKHTRVIP